MRVITVSKSLLVNRDSGRTKVRAEGVCRSCLRSRHVRRLTRHHLVPQSWFHVQAFHRGENTRVRDADANIVPLCIPCHEAVEEDVEARRMLRRVLTQAEVAFCVQVRGLEWLDRRYPPTRPTRNVDFAGISADVVG